MSVNRASTEHEQCIITTSTECQQSVNDFGYCILYNPRALLWQIFIMIVLAAVLSKSDRDTVIAPLWKWASTERQWFCVLHLEYSNGCATVFMHNRSFGSLYRQYRVCRYRCTLKWAAMERQQRVNRASTERQQRINTVSTEDQQSVNAFGCCIMYNPRALLRHRPIINELAAVLCKCDRDMVTAPVWKWASTERQQFRGLHLV
jgi:hypothetical protein